MRKTIATVFVGCSAMVVAVAAAMVFSPIEISSPAWTVLIVTQWCTMIIAGICIVAAKEAE